jgi:hypothetical protein
MNMRERALLLCLAAAAMVVAACTEPRSAPIAPSQTLEAKLELSDSAPHAGESLLVRIRLDGPNAAKIVSFTGRVSYDSTALRYVSESPLADGGTRVSNPASGLIRSAGVSANGFADGLLMEYRFVVVNPRGVSRLLLGIDELHDQSHVDASKNVVIRRGAGLSVP